MAGGRCRDPNLLGTIANYDGSAPFLAATELTDEALAQAVIGAVGDLDGPLSPDAKVGRRPRVCDRVTICRHT